MDPESEYTTEADVTYSHTHEAAVDLGIEEYLDEVASGQQPTFPYAESSDGWQTYVVPLFDCPLTLKGGYQCYHVASESMLADGQAFSGFHAKALLGEGRVDFKFEAPDRAEAWKERWLKILMSFRLCEGIEDIVDEFDENLIEESDEDFSEFDDDEF